ncbi:DUF1648 domain-containing protein [Flavobacterium sp. CS20]|uniref:DUF1648 domain-containing protein n=1 Tax=Flavobacterium sp. CS20 TaxID=2775246 RepID=UPI001B39EC0A|nr:DUF1648 domain-containing protein [Flavobacterium sp. CS20]QTY27745.1 DUF1648 domain-containing protein [Flavobacterium sp. CS20]
MVTKIIKILFLISISVFITYSLILFLNYSEVPETVVSHINIKGEADAYSNKNSLLIATGVNLIILIVIGLLIKNPQSANYPFEITDENRERSYYKMQLLLSIVAIITTTVFSYMIFKATDFLDSFMYLIVYIIAMPILTLLFFKNN